MGLCEMLKRRGPDYVLRSAHWTVRVEPSIPCFVSRRDLGARLWSDESNIIGLSASGENLRACMTRYMPSFAQSPMELSWRGRGLAKTQPVHG